jgi:hypothetical protein
MVNLYILPPYAQCDKCGEAEGQPTYPVEYPEDDGTTTTHYGCDQCIEQMWDMAAARKEG